MYLLYSFVFHFMVGLVYFVRFSTKTDHKTDLKNTRYLKQT